MRHLLAGILVLAAGAAAAEERKQVRVAVTGGRHDLANVVVRVPLPAGALAGATNARVQEGPGGALLLAQVGPPRLLAGDGAGAEITFILPLLKAGESKTLTVLTSYPVDGTPKPFQLRFSKEEHADVLWGTAPVLRYMHAAFDDSTKERRDETYKVFHHLYEPTSGVQVSKGAGGKYPHHRGIFFGFNKVTYGDGKKADVWHCTGDAHQSHDGFLGQAAGEVLGRHRVKVGWHGEKKQVFAEEERELTAYRRIGDGFLVEFASVVRPKVEKVRLDGDPQHAGFHFRAHNEPAEQDAAKKPQTYFLRPDGKGEVGKERNWDPKTRKGPVNLPWDAMSFVIAGKRYTVVYLDHPDNPKEARGSERVYGRVGSYFEYDLTADKPLRVQYRLFVQPGEMTVEQCEALSRAFTEKIQVAVK